MSMKLIIRHLSNRGEEKEYLLREGVFLIGRKSDSDIRLADNMVSRRHAEISVEDGIVIIEDLHSRNKTFVNSKPIQRKKLKNKDKIQIGSYVLEFYEKSLFDSGFGVSPSITKIIELDKNPLFTRQIDYSNQDELMQVHKKLVALYEIGNIINTSIRTDELLPKILDSIFNIINADRSSILLWDENIKDFKVSIARNRDKRDHSEIQFSKTIIEEVYNSNKAVLTLDARDDARFQSGQSIIIQNIHSAMCVPISVQDRILGVIYADTNQVSNAFDDKDLELLVAVALQAGIALENARLYSELEQLSLVLYLH